MDASTRFNATDLGTREIYKLLTGLVVPRPIAWVGTTSPQGTYNLAPFSFFNAVAVTPPTIMFAVSGQPGTRKDTLANVKAGGDFTVSFVSAELVEAMNATSVDAPAAVSEFELAGLTPIFGESVGAPYVAEASAAMECRLDKVVEIGAAPMGSSVVFGEVLTFHVNEDLLDGTRIDQVALHAVGRLAGSSYAIVDHLVDYARPTWPQQSD